jgi:hypothetical protein
MSVLRISLVMLAFALGAKTASAQTSQPDPNFHIYLLLGQSNMAGGGAISDSAPDCDTTPRVKVMSFADCSAGPDCKTYVMKRTHDQWYTAFPPLHDCSAGLEGICPGDWFGKTMIDSVRSDISIGLVPCALSGMALNVFLKGSSAKSTVGPPPVNGKNAYDWVISRAKLAQQKGVIKGILMHQGESGSGTSQAWDAMAMQIYNDLKTDLNLDPKTPYIVGQLRSDATSPSQNNTSFNTMISGMPAKYPNTGYASSQGRLGNGKDVWHFRPSSMREIGKRYARALLSLSDATYIPRKGSVTIVAKRPASANSELKISVKDGEVYDVNGKQKAADASKSPNTESFYFLRAASGSQPKLIEIK